MLSAYSKQEDVPEALREHYLKGADGKWHAEIPTDHPAIKDNAALLNQKQEAETKAGQLQGEVDHMRASATPRGHKAVPNADFELLAEVKALGPVADIRTKLEEHKTLNEEVTKRQREDSLKLVAKELGYDNVDAFVRLPGLPEFDIREKDGKKTVIAKVKDDKGVVTEKPAAEFIESSTDIAPFLPALKTTDGVRLHGTAGEGGGGADPFAWARDYGKKYVEQSAQPADIFKSFNERTSA